MTKVKINRILLGCIIFFAAVAQTSMGLSVTGSIFEANVTPGEHVQHEMTVEADSGMPEMDYTAEVIGYNQSIDGVNLEVPPENDLGPYTARPFLNVSPSRFSLKPGIPQKVILEGNVPADASPGERYAFVSICSAPIGNGTMAIQTAVDVLVDLLVTGGTVTAEGKIISINVTKSISSEQQDISLIFRNTGNYCYVAKAIALLESKDGQVLGNDSVMNYNSIIPQAPRRFQLFIMPVVGLKPGSYYVNATVGLLDGPVLDRKRVEFKV